MKRPTNKPQAKSDMTPMIDCVFLLIVFFLMNQFKTVEGHLDIFLPKDSGLGASTVDTHLEDLRLAIHPDGNTWTMKVGQMIVGRYPKSVTKWAMSKLVDDKEKFNEVVAKLEGDIRAHLSPRLEIIPEGQKVVIDIDGEAPYLFAVQIMNECKASGLANISFKGSSQRLRQ